MRNCCGGGAWPGFETRHRPTDQRQAPSVWRAPEGAAAVPVGGGGAWPGFETTRRAEGSRRGRLAGGPQPTGTHSGRAQRRPEHQRRHKQHTQEGRRAERSSRRGQRAGGQATRRPEI